MCQFGAQLGSNQRLSGVLLGSRMLTGPLKVEAIMLAISPHCLKKDPFGLLVVATMKISSVIEVSSSAVVSASGFWDFVRIVIVVGFEWSCSDNVGGRGEGLEKGGNLQ